jgi:hypothetical protein
VIGAALASVVSAVGTAVYSHSLHRTRARVRNAVTGRADDRVFLPEGRAAASAAATIQENLINTPQVRRRPRWRWVALGAVGVFVTVLALITGVELVAGRPISDVVRGDSGSGTSLFGGSRQASGGGHAPAPAVTQTVTPSAVVTTPTVTQTAPTVTKTATPTVTETPTSTPTPAPSTSSTTPAATATQLG